MTTIGDVGTLFIYQFVDRYTGTVVDVSGANGLNIIFKSPSAVVASKSASFNTDGVDGKIKYLILNSDLDEAGDWEVQGKATWATGSMFYGDIKKFTVYDALDF